MIKYRIFETGQFMRDLKALSRSGHKELEKKLENYVYPQLRAQPQGGLHIKRLRDWLPRTWRYRVGQWRFFYMIDEVTKVVSVVGISHRKDAYR